MPPKDESVSELLFHQSNIYNIMISYNVEYNALYHIMLYNIIKKSLYYSLYMLRYIK